MGGNYKDSKANTVVQNKNGKAHAMTLTMSGGALNTIYAQRGESVYAGDVYSGIEGDVSLDISGGMVNYVVGAHGSGRMEDGNLTSHSDLTITGGSCLPRLDTEPSR